MNALSHAPSRLVDVTDQTVVTSSQAAAAAAWRNASPNVSSRSQQPVPTKTEGGPCLSDCSQCKRPAKG